MWTETWGAIDITTENSGSYTIQKWDTLSKIAQEKKIPLHDLITAQWPNFDPNKLRIGQVLKMPQKAIDTTWVRTWIQRANEISEQAIMNALAEQEAAQAEMKEALDGVFGGTLNIKEAQKSTTETLIRFPYTADDFYSERNPVRLWVVHAELMNYATRGGTIEKLSPEIRKTLIEAISRVSATYDGGVNEINRPNISLANDALIRNPENVELVQLSWGDIQFRLKSDPTLHTFGYNSAQGIYGLKNIRS